MTLKNILKKELKNDIKLNINFKKEKKIEKRSKPKQIVTIWFGVPGSGKTTFAAWLAKKI